MSFNIDINSLTKEIHIARHHYSIELLKQNQRVIDYRNKKDLMKVDNALTATTQGHAVQKYSLNSILGKVYIDKLSADEKKKLENKYVAAPLVTHLTAMSVVENKISGKRLYVSDEIERDQQEPYTTIQHIQNGLISAYNNSKFFGGIEMINSEFVKCAFNDISYRISKNMEVQTEYKLSDGIL